MIRKLAFVGTIAIALSIFGRSAKGNDAYEGNGLIVMVCVVGDNTINVTVNVATHEVFHTDGSGSGYAPALAAVYQDAELSWILQSEAGKIFWHDTLIGAVGQSVPLHIRVFDGGKRIGDLTGKCTARN